MSQIDTHAPNHVSGHRARPCRGRLVAAAALLVLTLPATLSEADQEKSRSKPIRPSVAIDNEGPLVVIREARTMPGNDQQRLAGPGGHHWLPWRPAIRLDLILPIHTLPQRPCGERR